MTITALPAAPDPASDTPAEFSTKAAAHVLALSTFVTEANALAAAMNAIAAGGAMAIPYTFSTTTTDADPTDGFLRLDNATQNLATTIRADLLGSDTKTWTDVLNTFDDSTSTVKGYIRLINSSDATKFLIFSVSALASPSGYKNISAAVVASSAANPFANNDPLILYFTPSGDKGDTGAAGGVPDSEVIVHTGNGHGATNTKIRRFTTTQNSVGTAITYADSANDGATFTINETGVYAIYYGDAFGGGATSRFGVSVNSAQLTTAIQSITDADRLALGSTNTTSVPSSISRVAKLTAADVVRAHTDGNPANTSGQVFFSIRKIQVLS